jgi:hypothetical protein
MKKLILAFKSTILFIRNIFLQFLLSIVAFVSWEKVSDLGEMSSAEVGTYKKEIAGEMVDVGTSVALETGYIGGSISMGIICSICIIMIVWLEIKKKMK